MCKKKYDCSLIYHCKCVEHYDTDQPRIIRNFSESDIDILLMRERKVEYRRFKTLFSYSTEKIIWCNICKRQEKFLNRNIVAPRRSHSELDGNYRRF